MKIILVPLDERPVNTRYPQMIAAIAGVELVVPPPEVLPVQRSPADLDNLHAWLLAQSPPDVLVASVEMLTSGGLIASRISDDPVEALLDRLKILGRFQQVTPETQLYGFSVITRIPDADNAIEEPDYWAQYGRRIHRYSRLMHRAEFDQSGYDELAATRTDIPETYRQHFLRQRLRNHQLNLHLLEVLKRGWFDTLVISSDDTSEYGMGTQEKAWIAAWARRFEFHDDHLLMYPGADEVGCVLLGRALLEQASSKPTFYIHYAIEEDRTRIAPYEDSPIHVTVERQIKALSGQVTSDLDGADFIVAVNTPSRIDQEYVTDVPGLADEIERRAPYLDRFVEQVGAWCGVGRRVIVCDVAYPNGSDPNLITEMLQSVDLTQLAAYGAWNTAGNTIGTALAQGIASHRATSREQQQAHQRFLLHRFIEDWGYQHIVRKSVRDWLEASTGVRDTSPDNEAEAVERIHTELSALLPRLGALSDGWHIASVRLPWHRTFEIDFDLERR
jgi:hypothetical protein